MIALAVSLHADMVLMDERKGVKYARNQGLRVTGTLGLLDFAAQAGLVDFTEAVRRLRLTTFRSPDTCQRRAFPVKLSRWNSKKATSLVVTKQSQPLNEIRNHPSID